MATPSRIPALTAATNFRSGGASTFLSRVSFRQAIATARLAPVTAAVDSSFDNIARLSRRRRVWQHRVLRREPASANVLLLHPAGHGFFDHYAANHTCVTHCYEHRTT